MRRGWITRKNARRKGLKGKSLKIPNSRIPGLEKQSDLWEGSGSEIKRGEGEDSAGPVKAL